MLVVKRWNLSVLLLLVFIFLEFFFFKQKTAYELRISDWSSDVCSSDLPRAAGSTHIPIKLKRSDSLTAAPTIPTGPPSSNASQNSVPVDEIGRASCRERVCQYV